VDEIIEKTDYVDRKDVFLSPIEADGYKRGKVFRAWERVRSGTSDEDGKGSMSRIPLQRPLGGRWHQRTNVTEGRYCRQGAAP
jgi:hypothetical protein